MRKENKKNVTSPDSPEVEVRVRPPTKRTHQRMKQETGGEISYFSRTRSARSRVKVILDSLVDPLCKGAD